MNAVLRMSALAGMVLASSISEGHSMDRPQTPQAPLPAAGPKGVTLGCRGRGDPAMVAQICSLAQAALAQSLAPRQITQTAPEGAEIVLEVGEASARRVQAQLIWSGKSGPLLAAMRRDGALDQEALSDFVFDLVQKAPRP